MYILYTPKQAGSSSKIWMLLFIFFFHTSYLHFVQQTTSHRVWLVLVSQLCLTLCDPMDRSPPGSSVHGILQARILEWVAISFSGGSSQPRDWAQVSCIASRLSTDWATKEDLIYCIYWHKSHILFFFFFSISTLNNTESKYHRDLIVMIIHLKMKEFCLTVRSYFFH